jgi:hypothetical protein
MVACDSGFYYSTNGGASFTKDNNGLTYSGGALQDPLGKVTASTNYIYAATKNGKIYRRLKNQFFSSINEISFNNIQSKVYPNPASETAIIDADDLMFENNCEVRINDILGREVSVTEMKNGKAKINLSSFNKGIYSYSIYHKNTSVGNGKLVMN